MVEYSSTMTEEAQPSLHERIAAQVRQLRAARGLSLDALASHCGVSRSMISLIERGESSPTAVVLERLASGLGVPLAALFDAAPGAAAEPVARRAEQPLWRDPASGYVRRNVSPPGAGSPIRIVEVEFPAGAQVAYDTGARSPRVHQQIWVLEGRMQIRLGETVHDLATGDCLAHALDRPIVYSNPTRRPARYAVVLVSEGAASAGR
ncbi:MAG: DNA-binding protein [Variovorax paradoxus]|nr:MAG: DNA-binding protein [Variovorax paradoxus]PZQ10043.1 MAG: DNA-binding protein [Variovorax paradoxus]